MPLSHQHGAGLDRHADERGDDPEHQRPGHHPEPQAQGQRDPKNWKGFKFGIPFDYSIHNFLLRYYLAENGLNPDTDVQLARDPAGRDGGQPARRNIDGFLGPTRSTSARCSTRWASFTC